MQEVSSLYEEIIASTHSFEFKVKVNGTEYTKEKIISGEISSGIFDSLRLGGTTAKTLKLKMDLSVSIPSMASIEVFVRAINATQTSEWLPKGTYFIDTRSTDSDGLLEITAYDAMLKSEAVFLKTGSWASKSALEVLQLIASDMGIEINDETESLMTADPFTISYIPSIGEDGTTERELLSYIGVMYGGSFVVTDEDELRLLILGEGVDSQSLGVKMSSLKLSPAFLPISTVRLYKSSDTYVESDPIWSADYSSIITYASGDKGILLSNISGSLETSELKVGDYITINNAPTGSPSVYRVYVLYPGLMVSIEVSEGRTIEETCPYADKTMANKVLKRIHGFSYQPYSATDAELDPAMELGDVLTLNGTSSYLYSYVLSFDALASCSLTAKGDEEVSHEYPYKDPVKREISALKSEVETELKVLPGEILSKVSKGYASAFSSSPSAVYEEGSFVIYGDKYYICIEDTTGGVFDPGCWEETSAVDMSQSLIDQSADEIKAEVYGTYSEKWASGTKYYVGDIICLASSNKFYESLLTHTADSTNMPPNDTYWEEVDAPTGESFINLGIRGITIQNTGTTPSGSNQASIKLTKDNIDIAAGTITMSNVTVDSIAANKITAGTLNSDVIYSGTISADNISAGELDADKVTLKGLFSVTDKNDNDAGYIGGFTFGNNTFMYMKSPSSNAGISVADFDMSPDVALVGITADQLQIKAPMILDSDSYGTSLPSSGTTGQLFFLI